MEVMGIRQRRERAKSEQPMPSGCRCKAGKVHLLAQDSTAVYLGKKTIFIINTIAAASALLLGFLLVHTGPPLVLILGNVLETATLKEKLVTDGTFSSITLNFSN